MCSIYSLVLANVSTELEVRVETLEETAGNQEIRISIAEENIQGKKISNITQVIVTSAIQVLFHLFVV